MKKQEIIAQANQGHNLVWDLVQILEDQGKVEKTNKIRKPAVYIEKSKQLLNLSDTEILIVERDGATGPIVNYRLLKYDLIGNTVEGAYNPF
ncbi:hypothetical protein [Streptococcus minor]|uniref:hypothetical protein n=1 Tax=Streptococcus minor TaxID=229549 RepID=UPI0003662034|nr:hypothetical protein [Streptococcus minor]